MALVRICPKCGSKNVGVADHDTIHDLAGQPDVYVCSNCGFKGTIFPEVDEDDLKDLKRKGRVD